MSKNRYHSKKDTLLTSHRASGSFTKGLTQNDSNRMTPVASQTNPSVKVMNGSPAKLTAYLAAQQQGIIGLFNESQLDNPADNIFTVTINNQLNENDRVWLTYNLTGLDDYSNVACSVNDRLAMGGYLAKRNNGTTRQRVQLNAAWIRKGENRIQFGLPENANYGYKISDLSIEVEKVENDSPLIVNAGSYLYDSKAYIHGFVQKTTGDKAIVTIEGKAVTLRDGEFETIVTLTGKQMVEVRAQVNGKAYLKEIRFNSNRQPDHQYVLNESTEKTSKTFQKGVADVLQTENALLKVDDKALLLTQKLSLTTLRNMDLPALDMGMTNVTGNNKGFRFLPHGEHFTDGATVALKYDRSKIPDGYTENDIKSFYFDTHTNHWVALERDTVDKALCMVISKTTHFTDMINGIIKTPESPQTEGFTPTMMNGIKAADPTSKIELIAPPTANNQGSANLSYSLEMPPARNGMSPNLAIQYNSDGGSGWLGEGWDLNVPSITVDTRWGVPRYDPRYETETYMMGGVMLATVVNPVDITLVNGTVTISHKGVLYNRQYDPVINGSQFIPSVESGFSRIIRKDSLPGTYSWEVTDKNGTIYTYGANDSSRLSNTGNTVKTFSYIKGTNKMSITLTGKNIIAEWKLSRVQNLHGDFREYIYNKCSDSIDAKGLVTSQAIYLKQIRVGRNDTIYQTIDFVSQSVKSKKQNNARYGFLTSNSKLLDGIVVNMLNNNKPLRSYSFVYKQGAFNVTLLDKVTHKDSANTEIASHNFDYYNNVMSTSNIFDTSPKKLTLGQVVNSLPTLGGGKTTSSGGSVYIGIGAGNTNGVSGDIGYNHSFSGTKSDKMMMLIDINGDGLPDKVYETNNTVWFQPNLGNSTFGEAIQINGLTRISHSETKSHGDGLQANLQGKIGSIQAKINCGFEKSTTYSNTSVYFADVNNDGLIDVVDNGVVYFNHVVVDANGLGVPTFEPSSSKTLNPIQDVATSLGVATAIPSPAALVRDDEFVNLEKNELYEAAPLQDIVRVWEAPYSGIITISGNVQRLMCKNPDADDLRVVIQLNDAELQEKKIGQKDSSVYNMTQSISIKEGDRLYFRLQSGWTEFANGDGDIVKWNPSINYTHFNNTLDQTNSVSPIYNASEGFIVNKIGYNLIESGVPTTLKGNFYKPVTADDIKLRVYLSNDSIMPISKVVNGISCTVDSVNPNYHPKGLPILEIPYSAGASGNFVLNNSLSYNGSL